MDTEYLKQNVGGVLASGLAVTLVNAPVDPVEYLGNWLLKYVENAENKSKEEKQVTEFEQRVTNWKNSQYHEETLQAEKTRDHCTASKAKENFIHDLRSTKTPDELFKTFVNGMQHLTEASSVYIAVLESSGDSKRLRYVAATENDEFLVDDHLEAGKGLTLDLFQEPTKEADEEEPPADEQEAVKRKEEKEEAEKRSKEEIKMLNVPNVLLGPQAQRLHFHRFPRVGAYCTTRIQVTSALSEDILEAAVEHKRNPKKEEEKKSDELDVVEETPTESTSTVPDSVQPSEVPPIPLSEFDQLTQGLTLKNSQYALCFDTLGQSHSFTSEQIEDIRHFSRILQHTLEDLDHNLFVQQVEKRIRLSMFVETTKKEDAAKEIEEIKSQLGHSAKHEDIQFASRKHKVLAHQEAILELASFEVFKGPLVVLQALLLLLGYPKHQITDKHKMPNWRKIRQLLNLELLQKVRNFVPRDQAEKYPTEEAEKVKDIGASIEGLNTDELKDKNYPLAQILGLVKDALEVYKIVAVEREKRVQEERERERKEKEEIEKKAAAEAAEMAEAAEAEATEAPATTTEADTTAADASADNFSEEVDAEE